MRQNTKKLTTLGLVAALYAVTTLALSGISYGPIQFRIAEVMVLLPLLGKEYILALTVGCFLANVIGPYGVPDIIFGTLATFISTYLVYLTGKTMKNKKGIY
ncbi:QueT transporter family protein [[Clostridium] dakarense]|uniref:QueT transporter family protein n=1 Tax=Faecalimicrobium dakarense TaxID=1301100 RepID=UPI0004BB987F|nr:QueT transporter family protein [[Clostridium] dakarense]